MRRRKEGEGTTTVRAGRVDDRAAVGSGKATRTLEIPRETSLMTRHSRRASCASKRGARPAVARPPRARLAPRRKGGDASERTSSRVAFDAVVLRGRMTYLDVRTTPKNASSSLTLVDIVDTLPVRPSIASRSSTAFVRADIRNGASPREATPPTVETSSPDHRRTPTPPRCSRPERPGASRFGLPPR